MRPPPTCSEENTTGYSPRRMVHDELGKHTVSADNQFLYAHDYARLYLVISIAKSESLQFLFPEWTTCGNGIMLWNSIISKLFGMTYRDAFDAAEKLRKWNIDPSIPLSSKHDIHILIGGQNIEIQLINIRIGNELWIHRKVKLSQSSPGEFKWHSCEHYHLTIARLQQYKT